MAVSKLEQQMARDLLAVRAPSWEREFRFDKVRMWRFDFAWPEHKLAVECEGLVRPGQKSRHTTNAGFEADCEKYNAAALADWKVLRFTTRHIRSGVAIMTVCKALGIKTAW